MLLARFDRATEKIVTDLAVLLVWETERKNSRRKKGSR
jgi:hypothetical protein